MGHIDTCIYEGFIENPKSIQMQISKTLSDLYIRGWHSKVASSSEGLNYILLKVVVNCENYLSILSRKCYSALLKFRISCQTPNGKKIRLKKENVTYVCDINDIAISLFANTLHQQDNNIWHHTFTKSLMY